ncbi:hypothetical protein CSV79_10855 [Sporosarcina sp. P13]|uniref:hypothetical protein n=1 Tax=Sporosarcina sp. P13 TaxID=2048263 RepID=UPI000C16AE8E|nr:hypothetical protein [Sporosarcina sp. P13]PIC63631.1 hypothetical protein CSV79_10855 [Sporosarcina sp. P13]
MNKISKMLAVCFFAITLLMFLTENKASAKSNEKVYKAYSLSSEKSKFPIKLSNSLVIDVTSSKEPVIKKDGRVLWIGHGGIMSHEISFTVTKNSDTYFYHKTGVEGTESVEVVGVTKSGDIFMDGMFYGDGASMHSRFISPSIIEIGIEKYSPFYDGSTTSKHSGSFKSKFYQLYINGSAKEVAYFDNTFASLAKKGQLKWVPGALGMSFSKLKSVVKDPYAYQDIAEHYNFYFSELGNYGFYHNSNSSYAIKPNAKVRGIFRTSDLDGNRKSLRPFFRKQFGKEVLSYGNHLDVYRVDKYYLGVQYFDEDTVHLNLTTENVFR